MPEYAPPKFTWNSDSPAPFESSWMIFAKIMILNYLKPPLVWDVITDHPSDKKNDKKLLLHNSDWINFDRFSVAVGVKPDRLRKGFLDQLGFPHESTDTSDGIRFCPECLAKGYHCSFFNLALIDACPWHGCRLLHACKECAKTIAKGLMREKGKGQDYDSNLAASGANLIYRSNCDHLRYLPQMNIQPNSFSSDEESGINVACNSLLQWWYTLNVSQHPYASFARRVFTRWEKDEELIKCLEVACDIAGPCPWPLRLFPLPVARCKWRQTADPLLLTDYEDKQKYYETVYKSVRRHIFRRCLRKHRSCLVNLMSLTNHKEQYLISSTVCSLALAYISWRMQMERYGVLSQLRKKGKPSFYINTDIRVGVQAFGMTKTPKSMAHLWLIEFFAILNKIEMQIDKKSLDIYRWDASLFSQFNTLTCEFVPDGNPQPHIDATGYWLALYPNAEFYIKRGEQRCAGKLDDKCFTPEMYTVGSLSLLNYRPERYVLFRVINISEQRKNFTESYAYEERHYS